MALNMKWAAGLALIHGVSSGFGVQVTQFSSKIAFWGMEQTIERSGRGELVEDGEPGSRNSLELVSGEMSSDGIELNQPVLSAPGDGVSGRALLFDRSYAVARNAWHGYDAVRIEFWMKAGELPSERGVPVIYLMRTGAWDLTITADDQLQWTARDSDGRSVGFLRQSLSGRRNEWAHVIATFEPDLTMRLWVDGKMVATMASQSWWNRTGDSIQVGYLTGRPVDRAFSGWMDDIRITRPSLQVHPGPDVHMDDLGSAVAVDNGLVRLEFDKAAARVVSLKKNGTELMRMPGGTSHVRMNGQTYHQRIAYDHRNPPSHAHRAFSIPTNCEFSIVRHTPELIELSFVEDHPERFPFYFDSRFVVRAGESGFYNYVILEYDPERTPSACLQQLNLALRVNPALFDVEQVSCDRWRWMPSPQDIADGREVMDCTYELPEHSRYVERYQQRVYTKYNRIADFEAHRVHGLSSMNGGFGIWFIQPSAEYLNGAPATQELTVHQTETTPFMMGTYQDVHFGSERLFFEAQQGPWRKIFGPQFVYVNEKETREALWKDVREESESHIAQWPYEWMADPDYQVERAVVNGRLFLEDGTPTEGALLVLAPPLAAEASSIIRHWQEQGRGYTFWTRVDAEGHFRVPNVKIGEYTLYIAVQGVLEEFVREGISVPEAGAMSLGTITWMPRRHGRTAWEIGVADRDSTEFRSGDDFRHWGGEMRERFLRDFPDGVDFKAGEDDWSRDWNYVHLRVDDERDIWRVRFDVGNTVAGTAHLRLGIAGSRYAGLDLRMNGEAIGTLDLTRGSVYAGQGYPRSGSRGFYQELTVPFCGGVLVPGENVLELELIGVGSFDAVRTNVDKGLFRDVSGDPYRSIHYDYLRLELPEE